MEGLARRGMYRSKSSRRTRHPLPAPVSHERPTHTRTRSSKKTSEGSELPTSVRLSPHDIHTEITFISEDEVDVQLSLAEGAPMEISVRALAAQLTGDDAVRIEIWICWRGSALIGRRACWGTLLGRVYLRMVLGGTSDADGCAGQENDRHTTGAVCGGSFPARGCDKA